ncbi:hypothetical protein ABLE68_21390 [Nocardioides sp. CN2-186]|uniref:hypothetical protein n=1 Tax=Nocardioides tweenelious TaxID=3156607 RepID=UPI0032B37DA7
MTIDRGAVVQAAIIEAVFCVVGVLAGVVWQWLWTPAMGGVLDHKWAPADAIALSEQFSSTGWYVVVGAVAGLVTGAVVALFLDRAPLLTLAAVLVGSALAAWLMYLVGTALGPADPTVLAKTAADGAMIPEQLTVPGKSPYIAIPVGALIGVALVFLGTSVRRTSHEVSADQSVPLPPS